MLLLDAPHTLGLACTHTSTLDKMYSSLGMQSPFLGPAGVGAVDPHTFRRNMGDAYKRNWAGLHDSPRTAPSV